MHIDEGVQSIKQKDPRVFFQFQEQNSNYHSDSKELFKVEDMDELSLEATDSNSVKGHQWLKPYPESHQHGQGSD